MDCATGSSPLARGLPCFFHVGGDRPGIIPARAGFTRRGARFVLTYRDHPRSRGVYWIGMPDTVDLRGSSPLARGLPN